MIDHSQAAARAGFTLIELMVVLVLIGIAVAMIIPEMKGSYEDALLRATARKLADAAVAANSQAIIANETHRVRIDTAGRRYFIERPGHSSGAEQAAAPPVDIPGGSGVLAKEIQIKVLPSEAGGDDKATDSSADDAPKAGRADAIAFYGDGTADADEILLRDRLGFRILLQINPITARVRVTELERQ